MPSAAGGSNGRPDSEEQRQRVVKAMIELVVEQGYGATTVEQLLERAEVSRRSFRRLFGGK